MLQNINLNWKTESLTTKFFQQYSGKLLPKPQFSKDRNRWLIEEKLISISGKYEASYYFINSPECLSKKTLAYVWNNELNKILIHPKSSVYQLKRI